MSVAARLGESGGRHARAFPFRSTCLVPVALLCVALALLAWAGPASADMYQCVGAHGEAVFTSKTAAYSHCRRVRVDTRHAPAGSAASGAGQAAAKPPRGARVLRGAVYRVERADGSIEYTNVPPRHARGRQVTKLFTYIDTCAACELHSTIDWARVPLNLTAYDAAVRKAAAAYGVQPALLRAVIHAESAFNPNALSSKGAQGLMQLMPGTATDMGVSDAFDAAQNIRGGARYLAQLLKDFGGDEKLAAAAYNAGPAAVRKYDGVPPYAETRVYVQRVDTLYRRYAAALDTPTLADRGNAG